MIEDENSIEGNLILGKNAVIKKGAKIKGSVVIGDNCIVHSQAQVEDSVIWTASNIGEAVHITGCVIGSNCQIAPATVLIATAFVANKSSKPEIVV